MINYVLNGKATRIPLTVALIKKNIFIYEISYFPPYSYRKSKIEAKLDFSNYATKFDLKMQ